MENRRRLGKPQETYPLEEKIVIDGKGNAIEDTTRTHSPSSPRISKEVSGIKEVLGR